MAKLGYFDIPIELSAEQRKQLLQLEKHNEKSYDALTDLYNQKSGLANTWKGHDMLKVLTLDTTNIIQQILDLFAYKPDNWSFIKINKKVHLKPHKDTTQSLDSSQTKIKTQHRRTLIIFPLEPYNEFYAPCDIMGYDYIKSKPIESITFRPCYAFSTDNYHQVKNNKYCRKSLQLWYKDPIETIYDKFTKGLLLKKD